MIQGVGITKGYCRGVLYPFQEVPETELRPVIIFVHEFEPPHVLSVSLDKRIVGLVAQQGSITCHAANLFEELANIEDRNLNAIVAVGEIDLSQLTGMELEIDAMAGIIRLSMSASDSDVQIFEAVSRLQTPHYRQKTRRLTEQHEGVTWTCYRPHYSFSTLDRSLIVEGFRRSTVVLLKRPPCAVRFDVSGRFWLANEATPELLINRIISSPDWFYEKAYEQHTSFGAILDKIVQNEASWEATPDLETLKDGITFLWHAVSEFYSRLPLTMSTYEPLFAEFLTALQSSGLSKTESLACLRSLRRAEYPIAAFRLGAFFSLRKWLEFPASKPKIVRAQINFERRSAYDQKIMYCATLLKPSDSERLMLLRRVVPIMFEIKEEKFYVSKAIMGWLNVLLENAGSILVRRRLLKDYQEILDHSIEDILSAL